MTKGYSKLLINEHVIPNKGAQPEGTSLDIVMMAVFSSLERTERNWTELLTSAGFNIIKIWTYNSRTASLIEAEVA